MAWLFFYFLTRNLYLQKWLANVVRTSDRK
jgi:hypothetical protein